MGKKIEFYKYSATGNDFILMVEDPSIPIHPEFIKTICARKTGIGSDGLLIFDDSTDDCDFEMLFYNPDGSKAEMCGNGARAMLHFAKHHFGREGEYSFKVWDKNYKGKVKGGIMSVNMGVVSVSQIDLNDLILEHERAFFINSGVPHVIIMQPVNSDLDSIADFELRGAKIRNDHRFSTGTNVDFVSFNSEEKYVVSRVFERGVEGETLSSGTGATASAVAYAQAIDQKGPWCYPVHMKGGVLNICRDERGECWLSGKVERIYEGVYKL